MSNLRQCLRGIRPTDTTHPGLWVEKFLPDDEIGRRQELVSEASEIAVPDAYSKFFDRWHSVLTNTTTIVTRKAEVNGRLSVGLGGEAVLETAITLHRTYGVPYIPGSALKGLAANYARNRLSEKDWGEKSTAYKTMFGDTKSAGYVTFFDALYMPGSGHQSKPLHPDVITVHHPNYYQGSEPPADWDSPTPVPFLSATGKYLLAIGGPAEWVEKAYEILALALKEEGVGAKTSSGYGRMSIDGMSGLAKSAESSAPAKRATDPEQAIVDQFLLELQNLGPSDAAKFATLGQRWQTLEISREKKSLLAQALLEKLDKAGRTKKVLGKSWFQQLRSYVENGGEL